MDFIATRRLRLRWFKMHAALVALTIGGLWARGAIADEAPPVGIAMPQNAPQAVAGQIYEGAFEVEYAKQGILRNFEIVGEGWTILEATFPSEGFYVEPGVFRIPFRAKPTDPNAPIGLRLSFDRQVMTRSFAIGPDAFGKRGRKHLAVRRTPVGPELELRQASSRQPWRSNETGSSLTHSIVELEQAQSESNAPSGGSIPLRFTGRIVYDRIGKTFPPGSGIVDIPPMTLGVDTVRVRVIDNDSIDSETIWTNYTDSNGYFDSETVNWDDCDATGCDDPDLILEFELDTGVVDVTDNSLTEDTYVFSLPEVLDFTGTEYDFGTVSAGDPFYMPAFHIFNNLVREHRFLLNEAVVDVPKVQVEWPESSPGNAAGYYESVGSEIHIRPEGQWKDDTQTHEYGHHFLQHFTDPESPDYCNSYCDGSDPCTAGTDCEDAGHCPGCPETDHDAWNEGFPNWLADITTRWLADTFTNDDGTAYRPLETRSQENVAKCCQDDAINDGAGLLVESFVGALLRDIEDDNFDRHTYDPSTGSTIRDMTCLGIDEIFDVVVNFEPNTAVGFLNGFLLSYPQHAANLRFTARNIAESYESAPIFPPDSQPLGPVISLDSPTHPLGVGGDSYCITVTWDAPQDDVNGACFYDFDWATTSDVQLEFGADDVSSIGCRLSHRRGFSTLGPHYFGIEAQECDSSVTTDMAVFGPFTINDCNGSGVVDLCDISCDHEGTAECPLQPGDCDVAGCGTAEDCNVNLVPDECDIADGTSEDCNENGVPDECELMKNWAGGSGLWEVSDGWIEKAIPVNGDHVCIRDAAEQATVAYTTGDTTVAILASDENLTISDGADLTITYPSWVRGDLFLGNAGSLLRVDSRLDVDGLLTWSGSVTTNAARITGGGETHLYGGMNIAGSIVYLVDHDLFLEPGTTSVSLGRMDTTGSTLTVRPGAVFDHQSTSQYVYQGPSSTFYNQGTMLKTTSSVASRFGSNVVSEGSIHLQAGSLEFSGGSEISGSILADPGTTLLLGCGGQELLPSSTLQAERVVFNGSSCGTRTVRGAYNATLETVQDSTSDVVFSSEANVTNYGSNLILNKGKTFLDAVVGSPLLFDNLVVGGQVHFNSGDPIVATNFSINVSAVIDGSSSMTINGPFAWPTASHFNGLPFVDINAPVTLLSGGSVRGINGTSLNLASTAIFQGGLYFYNSAVLNILATGTVDLQVDGNVLYSASGNPEIHNAGALVKTAGNGLANVLPAFSNTGLVESRSGTVRFRDFTQTAGQMLLNGGKFGSTTFSSIYALSLQGGTLTGSGEVLAWVDNSGASLEPGLSAGTITMTGDYTQVAPAQLLIELGGPSPATEYDQLILSGGASAVLGGTLKVALINGFVPALGDTFDVVLSSDVVGAFDTIETVGFPAGLSVRVVEFAGGVRIEVFNPACDGIVTGGFGACPDAICFEYDPASQPSLATYRTSSCPVGGTLGGLVDVIRGKLSSLNFNAGTVDLGSVTPIQCGANLDSFLWSGPPPAPGDGDFYLIRPQGGGDYGPASGGDLRLAGTGDCP